MADERRKLNTLFLRHLGGKWGIWDPKQAETIGKCSNPAREARPENFRGIWCPKATKHQIRGPPQIHLYR